MKLFVTKAKLIFFFSLFSAGFFCQTNNTCANATPFCTGNTMQFPAGVNAGSAQGGPSYGCLGSQPNPAWFYMQIANGGPISIVMSANNDIDFICWGPFPNLASSCGNLTAPNIQSCSYSGAATETCTIANAIPGQFYILLITNFSNSNQQITFNQNNATAPGAGSTNCGLICTITASNSGLICSGQSATLSATTGTAVSSFTWTGPGGFTSNVLNPVVTNITAASVYTIKGATSSSTCMATTTINVTQPPVYTVTPLTATVCQGGVFTPSVIFGQGFTGTPCSNTGVGPACTSPAITQVGNPQTGQNGTTTWPAPYGNWYKNARHQMLFTAAELNAAGIGMGYITNLAFNVITVNGTTNYPAYTIRMKCTNVTALSGGFDNTGWFTVFSSNITVAAGWNTHNFTAPYYWDGVSNLLVDICYNMTPNYTSNCISPYRATAFNSCRVWYSDVNPACMTTANPLITTVNRPLIRFGNCTTPNPSAFSYSWSPGPGIAAPTASSTAITTQPITGTISNVIYSVAVTPTNVACPAIQTLTVTIVNPLTPTLAVPGPLCNTANTVNLLAVPGGGTWTNNAAISAGGVLTPALATIGTSTVLYSTVVGSCIATSTAAIDVSQFNTAAFSASIAPMCVTNPAVNLNSIVQSTLNGTWSGVNVTNNSFNPSGLATNVYTLTYNTTSSPNATLCPDVNSIAVSVLNPPTPTITASGPYCNTAGNVQMIVSPNSGSWTPVVYQTPTGIFSPSQAAIGSNTVQYVIGTSTCNTQATSTINIEAFVPAVITGSISDKCNTAAQVNLMPLVSNNQGVWSGPGVSGSVFDPTTSGTGNIMLTYNTNSSPIGLCPDQATLAVNVFSLATPVITQIGPFCNMHGAVMIPVTPLGGYFSSSGNGAINNQGLFVPGNASIGQNIVNYSVSAGPCVASAQTTINVEAFVSADFTKYAGPFCKNDPPINLNSIVQNQGGTWSGPAQMNGLFTPANANIGNNNIIIYYTNSSPTQSLCPDSSAIRIEVSDIPHVNVVSNIEKGCKPIEVTFNTPSANSGIGTWNFGDGSSAQNGLTAIHTFDAPGSYTVSFTYINDMGCGTQTVLPYSIKVFDVPQAAFSFSPEEVSMLNPKVQFTNLSTVLGNNTYQWQIADMYQLNDVNPEVIFGKAGDYMITLTAKTPEGCKDVTSQRVTIKNDFGVYVPNSFTPNSDGVNDIFIPVFSPYGLDLNVYDLEIFDRWGASLFHTKDYTIGWDGFVKGTIDPLKQDIYVYRIKYKDAEGKIYHKTGHVSLLK